VDLLRYDKKRPDEAIGARTNVLGNYYSWAQSSSQQTPKQQTWTEDQCLCLRGYRWLCKKDAVSLQALCHARMTAA